MHLGRGVPISTLRALAGLRDTSNDILLRQGPAARVALVCFVVDVAASAAAPVSLFRTIVDPSPAWATTLKFHALLSLALHVPASRGRPDLLGSGVDCVAEYSDPNTTQFQLV